MQAAYGQMSLFHQECQLTPNRYQIEMTMELGKRIEHCMTISMEKSKYHKEDVVQALREANWIDENGRTRITELQATFAKYFKGAFPETRLNFIVGDEHLIRTNLTALTSLNKDVHPEICILLRWFAENVSYIAAPRTMASNDVQRRPDRPTPLTDAVVAALAEHRTLKATAAALNIQQAVLSAFCDFHEIVVAATNRKLKENLTDVAKDYLEKMTPKEIADKYDVSLSQAYRWRKATTNQPLPSKTALADQVNADLVSWERAKNMNPTFSTQQLRRLLPNEYTRLQRNDKSRFDKIKPDVTCVSVADVRIPPQEVLKPLKTALLATKNSNETPTETAKRHSKYYLLKRIGVPAYALNKCEKDGLVSSLTQTQVQFVLSRILQELELNPPSPTALEQPTAEGPSEELTAKRLVLARERFNRSPESYAKKLGLRSSSIRKVLK